MSPKKKVLFLCTGNACRSQMAEGILRNLAGNRFEVFSAGTHPSRVHPTTIRVMTEWGIDISGQTSDHVDDYLEKDIDIVISLCNSANELCPNFPDNVERIHWSIPDPFTGWSDRDVFLTYYRACRNLLKEHIGQFLKDH